MYTFKAVNTINSYCLFNYFQTPKTVNTWKISGMLIVYWSITIKFRIRKQTSKPKINYRCCLRFSYLAPYWFISRNTTTFHKYFRCSRFCEFQGKVHWNAAHVDTTKMSGIKSAFIIYVLILKNLSESAAEVHLFYQFQYWSVRLKHYRIN